MISFPPYIFDFSCHTKEELQSWAHKALNEQNFSGKIFIFKSSTKPFVPGLTQWLRRFFIISMKRITRSLRYSSATLVWGCFV